MAELIPTSTEIAYKVRTTLSGEQYVFQFAFNTRDGYWYFDLLDTGEVAIVTGVKIVTGYPLLIDCLDDRRPPGDLYAYDTQGDTDPGRDDLSPPNPRVLLVYVNG